MVLHGRQAMPGSSLDYQELPSPLQPLARCSPGGTHSYPAEARARADPGRLCGLICMSLSKSQQSLAAAGEGGLLVEKLGLA